MLLLTFAVPLQGEVMEEHEDVRRNIAEKVSKYSVIYDDVGPQQQATGKKVEILFII